MQKVIFLESSNFHQKNWGSNWFHFDEFVKASFQTWQVVREGVGKAVQTFIAAEVSQKKLRKVWPTELPRFYQDVLKAAFFVGHETAECAKGVPYISKAWLVGYLKCINAKAFIVTLKILGRTCWIVLIAPFEVSMLKFWTSKSFQKFHVSPNSYQFSHKSVAMREAFLHPFGSILNGQVFCRHDIRQDTWESFWLLRFCWTNSFNLCSIGWISAHCLDTQHSCVPRWCHTSVYGRLWFRAKVKLLLSTDEAKCQIDPSVISWFWLLRFAGRFTVFLKPSDGLTRSMWMRKTTRRSRRKKRMELVPPRFHVGLPQFVFVKINFWLVYEPQWLSFTIILMEK